MNIEKLKELQEYEKDKVIDMTLFGASCGTAHCHAGWSIVMERGDDKPEYYDVSIADPWHVARTILELSDLESRFLFRALSHNDYNKCSLEEGIARLDYMIENEMIPKSFGLWGRERFPKNA